jgi:hypothetical protein
VEQNKIMDPSGRVGPQYGKPFLHKFIYGKIIQYDLGEWWASFFIFIGVV